MTALPRKLAEAFEDERWLACDEALVRPAAIAVLVAGALRAAAARHFAPEHQDAMREAADYCEREGTLVAALLAKRPAAYAAAEANYQGAALSCFAASLAFACAERAARACAWTSSDSSASDAYLIAAAAEAASVYGGPQLIAAFAQKAFTLVRRRSQTFDGIC